MYPSLTWAQSNCRVSKVIHNLSTSLNNLDEKAGREPAEEYKVSKAQDAKSRHYKKNWNIVAPCGSITADLGGFPT